MICQSIRRNRRNVLVFAMQRGVVRAHILAIAVYYESRMMIGIRRSHRTRQEHRREKHHLCRVAKTERVLVVVY